MPTPSEFRRRGAIALVGLLVLAGSVEALPGVAKPAPRPARPAFEPGRTGETRTSEETSRGREGESGSRESGSNRRLDQLLLELRRSSASDRTHREAAESERELHLLASRVAKEQASQGREARAAELLPGLQVALAGDPFYDPILMDLARARLAALDRFTIAPETTRAVVLASDTASVVAARSAFQGFFLELPAAWGPQEAAKIVAGGSAAAGDSPRVVLLIGHHEKGLIGRPRASSDEMASLDGLIASAAAHGVLLLPIGCEAGLFSAAGPTNILRSVDVVARTGTALRATRTVPEFMAALGASVGGFRFDATRFQEPVDATLLDAESRPVGVVLRIPPAGAPTAADDDERVRYLAELKPGLTRSRGEYAPDLSLHPCSDLRYLIESTFAGVGLVLFSLGLFTLGGWLFKDFQLLREGCYFVAVLPVIVSLAFFWEGWPKSVFLGLAILLLLVLLGSRAVESVKKRFR